MTRPRRSSPGIAFAADRAGRFHSGSNDDVPSAAKRETLDIVAVGRHVGAANRTRRTLVVVGGAALVALAFVPRGLVGVALAASGVALLVRGMTGQSLAETVRVVRRGLQFRSKNEARDEVDQASWESFPASDPPAHSPSKS